MNLHANAALSWSGRRRLCELVVVEGLTVTAAAASMGVSGRCARKWVSRYREAGVAGLVDRFVGAAACCQSHAAGPDRGDRQVAPASFHGGRDR